MHEHRPQIAQPSEGVCGNKNGIVLFLVMAILGAIAVIGGTVFLVTTTDIRISGNYKTLMEAFNHADGGIQYVKSEIDQDLASGTLTMFNPIETVNYQPPSGFEFDPVTNLVQQSNTNTYLFQVVGHSLDSEVVVQAVLRRNSTMQYGIFGDNEVDMKAYGNVYSYDSRTLSTPTPADSTGDADTASNESFITHQESGIDGNLDLGADASGTQAEWFSTGTPNITGDRGEEIDHIDPDPMGAIGGDLADDFALVSGNNNNNNADASPPIPANNRISLGNGDTMTLPSGDYYIEDITLMNGSSLLLDTSSGGEVNIYLTGDAEAKAGSTINMTGAPTDFNLYSNGSGNIILKHDGTWQGMIYAPYASVEIKNSADFYGTVWAAHVDIKNSGEFYVDNALTQRFWSDATSLISWKEVRD